MTGVLASGVVFAVAALLAPGWLHGMSTVAPVVSRIESAASRSMGPDADQRAFEAPGPFTVLPRDVRSIATIAGTLSVSTSGSEDRLALNGKRLALPGPHFSLLSILRQAGQDIVLVGMRCGSTACTYDELAFVRLYSDRAPLVEMRPELRVPVAAFESLGRDIRFVDDTMQVPLGIEKGTRLVATIGAEQQLVLSRSPARTGQLKGSECRAVRRLVQQCASFKSPCSDTESDRFPSNCPSATPQMSQAVSQLADATTGFDATAFAKVCSRASRLGIVPSDQFIWRELCSGRARRP